MKHLLHTLLLSIAWTQVSKGLKPAIAESKKNWLGEKGDVLRLGGDELLIFSVLREECK